MDVRALRHSSILITHCPSGSSTNFDLLYMTVDLGREEVNLMIVLLKVGVNTIVEGGHNANLGIDAINYGGQINETVMMHCNAVHVRIGFWKQGT